MYRICRKIGVYFIGEARGYGNKRCKSRCIFYNVR